MYKYAVTSVAGHLYKCTLTLYLYQSTAPHKDSVKFQGQILIIFLHNIFSSWAFTVFK